MTTAFYAGLTAVESYQRSPNDRAQSLYRILLKSFDYTRTFTTVYRCSPDDVIARYVTNFPVIRLSPDTVERLVFQAAVLGWCPTRKHGIQLPRDTGSVNGFHRYQRRRGPLQTALQVQTSDG